MVPLLLCCIIHKIFSSLGLFWLNLVHLHFLAN
jgi:hypothetical protein